MSEALTARGMSSIDLSSCDREPIHIPGSIQPHGMLLAVRESDWSILQASENTPEFLEFTAEQILGRQLADVFGGESAVKLQQSSAHLPQSNQAMLLHNVRHGQRQLSVIGHRADGLLILEIESASDDFLPQYSASDLHPLIASFIANVQAIKELADLGKFVVEEIRRCTGFDRALVYRFEEDGTGIVVAESRNENFPSLQDHRFPASDIPKQARELYRVNRLRIIPNADYRPAPLSPRENPLTGKPLDLSYSILRSVSPVHVEYMKNMKTAASMSVSIIVDGKLWGLISCHHATPRTVPFEVRTACDLMTQVFSLQVGARSHAVEADRRVRLHSSLTRLLAKISDAESFVAGLAAQGQELVDFVQAAGAAVVGNGECELIGTTPSEQQVRRLADWLFREKSQSLFSTNSLSQEFEEAAEYADKASGLLAFSVSQVHPTMVLWFRPEVIETIRWGGDPRKPAASVDGGDRIDPRKSFETWRETVRRTAVAWNASELEAVDQLRHAVLVLVLKKAEELASLSTELRISNQNLERFNKELEAFSYSVSHDLRAPLRHIVGYAELLKEAAGGRLEPIALKHADTIIESSEYAGRLIDSLLSFSRMGRTELSFSRIDLNLLVRDVQTDVMQDAPNRRVRWEVADLPSVRGDLMMLKLAVRNLLANALKYTRTRQETSIEIGCRGEGDEWIISVQDNGVGFDMRYQDKLFGVFQRLHRWEEFEGTGIGLANVRRIIERHGGRTWAVGEVDQGATFYFSLPVLKDESETPHHAETDPPR